MENNEKREINSLGIALIRYYLESNNIKLEEVYNEAPLLEDLILNQSFISHGFFLKLVEKLEKKFNDQDIIEKVGQTASCLRPNGLIKTLAFKLLSLRKIISYYPKYFKYFYNDAELKILENNSEKTIIEICFSANFEITDRDKKFVKGLLSSIPLKRKTQYSLGEIEDNSNIYIVILKWEEKQNEFLKKISLIESRLNNFLRQARKKIKAIKNVRVKTNVIKIKAPKIKKLNFRKPNFKNIKIVPFFKNIADILLKKFKREKMEIIDLRKTIHEEMIEYEGKFKDREEEKEEILNEPSRVIEETEENINSSEISEDIQNKIERMKQKLKEEMEFSQKMRNMNNKLINKIEYLEKINMDISNEQKSDKIILEKLKEGIKEFKDQFDNLKIKRNTFVYDIIQNLKSPILRIVTSLEIVKNNISTQDEDQNEFFKEAVNASQEILSLVGYSIEFNKDVETQESQLKTKFTAK